jgi:hypothetical protein
MKELEDAMELTAVENYDSSLHDQKTWSEYTFGDMPVIAVYAMLRKFQNDALVSEEVVINFLYEQMADLELNYDKYVVLSWSSKPYVRQGETYEAEIVLGCYDSQTQFSVTVDGDTLNIIDGKAQYQSETSGTGKKKYTAEFSVLNNISGLTETFSKTFHYEVVK